MASFGKELATVAVLAALAAALPQPALAQEAVGGRPTSLPVVGEADGAWIGRVSVRLSQSSGSEARNQAILQRVVAALRQFEGQTFNRFVFEARLAALRTRMGTGGLSYQVRDTTSGAELVVEIDTTEDVERDQIGALRGRPSDFPVLLQNERAYLTAIISGGGGVYSDRQPWFGADETFLNGSPIAGVLPGTESSWTEGFIEYGLGGVVQINDLPLYGYAAVTGLTSTTQGPDIFRGDDREFTALEKAYAGLLWVDPDADWSANLSIGRQNVTLNDGFLVHFVRGSANAGPRAASFIGARNANDFSTVFDWSAEQWAFKAFYIDPNELEFLESGSTFLGANLRFSPTPQLSFDATLLTIPSSESRFAAPGGVRLPREDLMTLAGHARWTKAFGIDGLWLESEFGHQTHPDYDLSAWAGYGLVGWRDTDGLWTPSISYRLSAFSGDDPSTTRFERWDPLLSTGLGNWLQGVNFGKVVSNSNVLVHRVQVNFAPTPRLNISFDWHRLQALESNNLGANPVLSQLASTELGDELTLTARWAMNDNLYLQSLASVALPGKALRAVGADKPWLSLQSSLYWSF
jgi:hypothetical protein